MRIDTNKVYIAKIVTAKGDIVLESGKGIRGQFDAFGFDETFIIKRADKAFKIQKSRRT